MGRDLGLTEHVGLFRPIYFTDFNIGSWNIVIDPNFIIPFGTASVSVGPGNLPGATSFNTSSTGFGDFIGITTFWFIHNDEKKFYTGFTPIFIAPTGTYSRSRLLNVGANRWSFDAQGFIVKGFQIMPEHFLYFEGQVHGQFYTNNTNAAGVNGRVGTLSQDPELNVEAHISYDLTKTMFASVDYFGSFLSNQKFNGVSLNNELATNTIGVTMAYSFAPGYQLMLNYRGDVSVKNGTQTNTFLVRFLWATDFKALTGALTK